jgi:amidase
MNTPVGSPDSVGPYHVAVMIRETGAAVEPEVEAAVLQTADLLSDAGYEIVKAGIPMAERAPEVWAELLGTELIRFAMPAWDGLIADSNRQHIETMFGLFELGPDVAKYIAAFAERRALTRETATWMEEHPIVLAPINGMPTPPLDFDQWLSVEATRDLFDHMRNVMWVNLTSLPSIALPNGVQLVGRRFREDEVFRAAHVVEESLGRVTVATPT